jgi:hypothetical protein
MPLINCPECKAQVSDKAASCIKCGFPFQNQQEKPALGVQLNPALTIGRCSRCGSADTGDIVSDEGRTGLNWSQMLGTRMGAYVAGGRYYCRKCHHRWKYNS